MPEWPTLDVRMRHRIGPMVVDVDFRVSKPWTVLFAPSGAGKTTILRAIAGLMRPGEARIVWTPGSLPGDLGDGPPLCFTDTAENRMMPAFRRRFPMVTQEPALFPHLTVAANVAYGSKKGAEGAQKQLRRLLELCRIEEMAGKMPAQLSGGERQRVALARALGADGLAILLDEPFAGLDGLLKDSLMRDVKEWLGRRRVPVLHVTHDVGEVFAVSDEVILLGEGRVVAQGPAEEVLGLERERLVRWLGTKSRD